MYGAALLRPRELVLPDPVGISSDDPWHRITSHAALVIEGRKLDSCVEGIFELLEQLQPGNVAFGCVEGHYVLSRRWPGDPRAHRGARPGHVRLRRDLGSTDQGRYGSAPRCDQRDPDATVAGPSADRPVRARLRGHRLAGNRRAEEHARKLNGAISAGLADPKFNSRFTDLGAEIFAGSPADFGRFIVDYTEKWAKVIRTAGVKAE